MGRILTFLDELPLFSAEKIDHKATCPDEVKLAVNAEYGQYLAIACTGYHGSKYKGAAAHSPEQPPIADISSTGHLGKWAEEGFVKLFHTGTKPDGKTLSKYMPVKDFAYTDDELKAIYLHLHGVK